MHAAVLRECKATRASLGIFDASTLGKIEVAGPYEVKIVTGGQPGVSARGGENLLKGLSHLLADLERGKGRLRIRMTDDSKFRVGDRVACAGARCGTRRFCSGSMR